MATDILLEAGIDQRKLANEVRNATLEGLKAAGSLSVPILSKGFNSKAFQLPLGRITGDLNNFQSSLDASVARVLAFGASASVLSGVTSAFKAMVASAIEVEKVMADINSVFGLTSAQLDEFQRGIFAVARNTAQSFETVSKAALELSRQGLSAEETLKRLNDAMILSRLSGLDAATAVATLTATVNGFQREALDTSEAVNRMAAVDAAFAVSSLDLANALSRSSAVAQDAGVSFNELIASVTAVQQITARGGSVIGNALKSIFTRLERSKTREELEAIGVATSDASGNFRGAIPILQDYAKVYQTLSDAQKSQTAELIAGVYQVNTLKAFVGDLSSEYSVYARALQTASAATDEAYGRSDQLNETLSALATQTALSIKEVGTAIAGLSIEGPIAIVLKGVKQISDSLNNLLDPKEGNAFVKAFFGGIGDFLTGPGLAIIGKAVFNLVKFLGQQVITAFKQIQSLNLAKEQQLKTEQAILSVLKSDDAAIAGIIVNEGNRLAQEKAILGVLQQQANALKNMEIIKGAVASFLAGGGAKSVPRGLLKAEGHAPFAAEESIARSFGASAGVSAHYGAGTIGGRPFVMNSQEVEIPNFGINGDSAVIPMYPTGNVPTGRARNIYLDADKLGGIGVLTALSGDTDSANYTVPTTSLTTEEISNLTPNKDVMAEFKKGGGTITLGNMQVRSFDRVLNNVDANKKAFSNTINRFFANPVLMLGNELFGSVFGRKHVLGSGRKNILKNTGGRALFSPSAEGAIFETALRAVTANKDSMLSSFEGNPNAPFDFEARGPANPDISRFYTKPVYKVDAKRTASPDQLRSIIGKTLRDPDLHGAIPSVSTFGAGGTSGYALPASALATQRNLRNARKASYSGKAAGHFPRGFAGGSLPSGIVRNVVRNGLGRNILGRFVAPEEIVTYGPPAGPPTKESVFKAGLDEATNNRINKFKNALQTTTSTLDQSKGKFKTFTESVAGTFKKNAGIATSFAAYQLGSGLQQSQNKTIASAGSAITAGLQVGQIIGAFNPLIGVLAGLGTAAVKFAIDMNDNTAELTDLSNKLTAEQQAVSTQGSAYVSTFQQLQEALKNGADNKTIIELTSKNQEALVSIENEGLKNRLLIATDSVEQQKILAEEEARIKRELAEVSLGLALKDVEKNKSAIGRVATKSISETLSRSANRSDIVGSIKENQDNISDAVNTLKNLRGGGGGSLFTPYQRQDRIDKSVRSFSGKFGEEFSSVARVLGESEEGREQLIQTLENFAKDPSMNAVAALLAQQNNVQKDINAKVAEVNAEFYNAVKGVVGGLKRAAEQLKSGAELAKSLVFTPQEQSLGNLVTAGNISEGRASLIKDSIASSSLEASNAASGQLALVSVADSLAKGLVGRNGINATGQLSTNSALESRLLDISQSSGDAVSRLDQALAAIRDSKISTDDMVKETKEGFEKSVSELVATRNEIAQSRLSAAINRQLMIDALKAGFVGNISKSLDTKTQLESETSRLELGIGLAGGKRNALSTLNNLSDTVSKYGGPSNVYAEAFQSTLQKQNLSQNLADKFYETGIVKRARLGNNEYGNLGAIASSAGSFLSKNSSLISGVRNRADSGLSITSDQMKTLAQASIAQGGLSAARIGQEEIRRNRSISSRARELEAGFLGYSPEDAKTRATKEVTQVERVDKVFNSLTAFDKSPFVKKFFDMFGVGISTSGGKRALAEASSTQIAQLLASTEASNPIEQLRVLNETAKEIKDGIQSSPAAIAASLQASLAPFVEEYKRIAAAIEALKTNPTKPKTGDNSLLPPPVGTSPAQLHNRGIAQ